MFIVCTVPSLLLAKNVVNSVCILRIYNESMYCTRYCTRSTLYIVLSSPNLGSKLVSCRPLCDCTRKFYLLYPTYTIYRTLIPYLLVRPTSFYDCTWGQDLNHGNSGRHLRQLGRSLESLVSLASYCSTGNFTITKNGTVIVDECKASPYPCTGEEERIILC
jgi:hypothetical protein